MYVSQTTAAKQSQNAKRKKSTNSSGSTFRLPGQNAGASAAPISAAQSAGSIGALLAVQEVDQIQNDRKRTVQQGREILDLLDELKLGLLSGDPKPEKLRDLQATVEAVTVPPGDKNLKAVMDGILLRAKVELAKRNL